MNRKDLIKSAFSSMLPWTMRWFVISQKGIGYMKKNSFNNETMEQFISFHKRNKIEINKVLNSVKVGQAEKKFELRITPDEKLIEYIYSLYKVRKFKYRYGAFAEIYERNNV